MLAAMHRHVRGLHTQPYIRMRPKSVCVTSTKQTRTHLCILLFNPDLFVGHHPHHMALLPHYTLIHRNTGASKHLHKGRAANIAG